MEEWRNGGSHPEIQIGLPVFPIGNTIYSTDRNTDPNSKHSLGGVQGRNTNTVQTEIQIKIRNTHWEVVKIEIQKYKVQYRQKYKSKYETLTGRCSR